MAFSQERADTQSSFFDLDNQYAQLNKLRDPLIELNRVIEWELFRAPLSVLSEKPRKSAAGRKQIDRGLLFKQQVGVNSQVLTGYRAT